MEATDEQPGLLHLIHPPRLEDAGLEDCALPPDSIKEAFLKAATAVKSRATSIFTSSDDEDDCVDDPWEARPDAVVGAEMDANPGGCGGEKGGAVEVGGDEVVVGGEEEMRDKVIVGGEDVREVGGDKACVDGLVGLEIGDKNKKKKKKKDNDEGPILVGGYA